MNDEVQDGGKGLDASIASLLREVRKELRDFKQLAHGINVQLGELQSQKSKPYAANTIHLEEESAAEPKKNAWDQTRQHTRKAASTIAALRARAHKQSLDDESKAIEHAMSGWINDADAIAPFEARAKFVVSEAHALRQLWDLVSAVLILYSLVLAPMDLAFRPFLEGSPALFGLEVFMDVFFLADVILNFFTTYIENGNEVRSLSKIAWRYMSTWLLIDAVASIPFSFLTLAEEQDSSTGALSTISTNNLRLFKVLKLFKIGRVFRLKKAARVLEEVLPTSIPNGIFGLLGLIMCQCFFWHLLGCLFWAVEYEMQPDDARWRVSIAGTCYREPKYTLPSAIFTMFGHQDAANFHNMLHEPVDWSNVDVQMLSYWTHRLVGGSYEAAAAAVLDEQSWDDVETLLPHSLSHSSGYFDADPGNPCAGHAIDPTAQLAAVLVEAIRQQLTLAEVYSYAILQMMGLSVGEIYEPSSSAGVWFEIFALFVSTYFETFVIGYVCNVVDQIDEVGKAQRERMLSVRLFLRMRHVDRKTTRKVLTFLDHTWRMHGGTIPDTKQLLSQLPQHLQMELISSADKELVRVISSIFHVEDLDGDLVPDVDVSALALAIVMRMKPLVAMPDQARLLQRKGARVVGLFIIVSGTCLYDPCNGEERPKILHKGACFGIEMLQNSPGARIADAAVIAREICELMYLPIDEFEALTTSTRPEDQVFVRAFRTLWQRDGSIKNSVENAAPSLPRSIPRQVTRHASRMMKDAVSFTKGNENRKKRASFNQSVLEA